MSDQRKAAEKRLEVYNSFRELFASAPIRLMSRTVSKMRSLGFDDLPAAIGELDWRTVPADDPEDPNLREDWGESLRIAFSNIDAWLNQLGEAPMGYNLESVGYPSVLQAWKGMWKAQLGIDFEIGPPYHVFLFHGGNQAVQAALLSVSEAHRDRAGNGRPFTILVPVPTFSCPLDQMALQGWNVVLLPPSSPGMEPLAADLARVPEGVEIHGVYAQPINNPTGRTVQPAQLRAFVDGVLARWPDAGIVLDSVYARIHPLQKELFSWYESDRRYADAIVFIDSLSKTHGVTGLRAGAVLSRAERLTRGVLRYSQNVLAGPSNAVQAVMLGLLAPFGTGDHDLADNRIRLQLRIGRHLQHRRRVLLRGVFAQWGRFLDSRQPLLPDPERFDWEGSIYATLLSSPELLAAAKRQGISPAVALYLETGIAGVPLDGFCRSANLDRHKLVVNHDDETLRGFLDRSRDFVRLSFGVTPPPREVR